MQSCLDDEGYDLGNFMQRMATVKVINGNDYYLVDDEGTTYYPGASQIPNYIPVDGKRVWADITLLADNYAGYDHAIRVNYLYDVLTKQVEELTAENEAEYGDDGVYIYDMWVGANYLNVYFGYYPPAYKAALVSLVKNTTVENPDDGYIYLEYRYNDHDDVTSNIEHYSRVSFNLGEYAPSVATSYKGLKIRINSAVNGERILTYDFNSSDAANK